MQKTKEERCMELCSFLSRNSFGVVSEMAKKALEGTGDPEDEIERSLIDLQTTLASEPIGTPESKSVIMRKIHEALFRNEQLRDERNKIRTNVKI